MFSLNRYVQFCKIYANSYLTARLRHDDHACGSSQKEHDERLEKVLSAIEKAGLTLNEKCEFSKPSVKFLGQIIDSSGCRVDPDKVKAQCFLYSDHNDLMSRKKQAHALSAGMHFLGPCPKSTRYLLSVIHEAAINIGHTDAIRAN
jgi:hypothetical protein